MLYVNLFVAQFVIFRELFKEKIKKSVTIDIASWPGIFTGLLTHYLIFTH